MPMVILTLKMMTEHIYKVIDLRNWQKKRWEGRNNGK